MKKFFYFLIFLCSGIQSLGQNNFTAIIRDSSGSAPSSNVSVIIKGTGKGSFSDLNGKIVLKNIPDGGQTLVFSGSGYRQQSIDLVFPLVSPDSVYSFSLSASSKQMEEVIILSSRTDSRIENLPTRVEILETEVVEEESGVKPSHIASLLGNVAGIQKQQTSAISASTELRIQGFPGNYTQILRDGMPLFGGYSGSFSVLQMPPLDLRQIEIIKGPSSTFYGSGAIAGLINVISKKPKLGVQERYLLFNQSTLGESNINIFITDRDKKRGYTLFAGGTYQRSIDRNKDGFSDLPLTETVLLHPTFYIYPNEKNTISVGLSSVFEERKGGDMHVLKNLIDSNHQFYILNRSYRNTLDITLERKMKKSDKLAIRGTGSWYYRNITSNTFGLRAKQISFFTEVSYFMKKSRHDLVAGINVSGEHFRRRMPDSSFLRNYDHITTGYFIQDVWRVHPKFIMETGIRSDFHSKYGTFILPRISMLYKISPSLNTRLGGGLGYNIPTLFNSENDERDYQIIRFDSTRKIVSERSAGLNWDLNFRKKLGEVELTINQFFYLTNIENPIVAASQTGFIYFKNQSKPILSKGSETWVMIAYKGLEAYLGYTLADAQKKYDDGFPHLELSAKNKFTSVISYEFSERLSACIEAAYTGRQYRADGTLTPSFPFVSGMVRYDIGRFSFVLNGENWFDYRQTNKETILIPPLTNPRFKQLWAPIDGRVINLSMKISF